MTRIIKSCYFRFMNCTKERMSLMRSRFAQRTLWYKAPKCQRHSFFPWTLKWFSPAHLKDRASDSPSPSVGLRISSEKAKKAPSKGRGILLSISFYEWQSFVGFTTHSYTSLQRGRFHVPTGTLKSDPRLWHPQKHQTDSEQRRGCMKYGLAQFSSTARGVISFSLPAKVEFPGSPGFRKWFKEINWAGPTKQLSSIYQPLTEKRRRTKGKPCKWNRFTGLTVKEGHRQRVWWVPYM